MFEHENLIVTFCAQTTMLIAVFLYFQPLLPATDADNIFNRFKKELDLYDKAPKRWFSYVENLLESSLHGFTSAVGFSKHQLDKISRFMDLVFAKPNSLSLYSSSIKRFGSCARTTKLRYQVTRVSSHLHTVHLHCPWTCATEMLRDQVFFLQYDLQFSMNRDLFVNLTVRYMFLYHPSFFEIKSRYPHNEFRFSGEYSEFCLFPPSNDFSIIPKWTWRSYYLVDMIFIAIDRNLVSNTRVQQVPHPPVKLALDLSYKIKQKTLVVWWIQTIKSHVICVNTTGIDSLDIHVFDGPTGDMKLVNSVNKALIASTFQCFVQVVISSNWPHQYFLQFSSKIPKINKYLSLKLGYTPTNITFVGLEKPMKIRVSAPLGFQVNATLRRAVYLGYFDENCNYGGVFSSKHPSDTPEGVITCSNVSSATSRSFYSANRHLFLFMFCYPEVSSLESLLFLFTTTLCKAVYLKPCFHTSHQKSTLDVECYQHTPPRYHFPISHCRIEMNTTDDCVVYQITGQPDTLAIENPFDQCQVTFADNLKATTDTTFNIRGSFFAEFQYAKKRSFKARDPGTICHRISYLRAEYVHKSTEWPHEGLVSSMKRDEFCFLLLSANKAPLFKGEVK